MDHDLFSLLEQADFLHSPFFGLSLQRKLSFPGEQSKWPIMNRIAKYLNVGSLAFIACLGVFVSTFTPSKYESFLLMVGDAPMIIMNKNRSLLTALEIGYFLIPFLYLLFFYCENYNWLRSANREVHSLRLVQISLNRFQKKLTKIKIIFIVFVLSLMLVIASLVATSYLYHSETFNKYPLFMTLPGSIYITFLHSFINLIVFQFITRIYVMIIFTEDLYKKLNVWVKHNINNHAFEEVFEQFFTEYNSICLMFSYLRPHIKRYFLIVVAGLTPSAVLLFYIPFHRHEQPLLVRSIAGISWFVHVGCVVWFASLIGRIYNAASQLESIFYKYFILNLPNFSQLFRTMVSFKSIISTENFSTISFNFHIVRTLLPYCLGFSNRSSNSRPSIKRKFNSFGKKQTLFIKIYLILNIFTVINPESWLYCIGSIKHC